MIHELNILDIVSYFIESQPKCELEDSKIRAMKKDIEARFASLEVKISYSSIERFAEKYKGQVTISTDSISISVNSETSKQIMELRSSYMEDSLKDFLKDKKYL